MLAEKRQEKIYEKLILNGAVCTTDLVKEFKVSIETIRRDLLSMEKHGLLKRVHGGAVTAEQMRQINTLELRNEENRPEKNELARNALQFLADGDIIGIDTGSTAISLAHAIIGKFSRLTVITHSADVFNILQDNTNYELILSGGSYLASERAFYGPFALDTLGKLNMTNAFIFPSAVSLKHGICDYNPPMLEIQRTYITNSQQTYILADSTKFEKQALLKLDDMSTEYTYITDCKLSDELKKIYKDNNIKIITEEM